MYQSCPEAVAIHMMTGGHFSQIVNLCHPHSFPSLPPFRSRSTEIQLEIGPLNQAAVTIRYDMIAEYNVALKAEYSAISSTCSRKSN